MTILSHDNTVLAEINSARLLIATENSLIQHMLEANQHLDSKKKQEQLKELSFAEFENHPGKVQPFMNLIVDRSLPNDLSIEDILIYLDWTNLMGAQHAKVDLFHALFKHQNLEEYCEKEENRQKLRALSQKNDIAQEFRQYLHSYLAFYGNTHMDKISLAETSELEVINHRHYYGFATAEEASKTLQYNRDIDYVLRNSSEKGCYTLSYSFDRKTRQCNHTRFQINADGTLTPCSPEESFTRSFASLDQLIQSYVPVILPIR